MASFKSVFLLLVILAGGILLAAGEETGPAGDNDNGILLPAITTNNDTLELEMVCLYKHWLKHHGERTDYTLIQFELDPRFLLFKSYFEPIPAIPTLESKCSSRKDNSTITDSPKDNGSRRDDQHNNSTTTDFPKNYGNDLEDQHNNSTVTDAPKDNGNDRDDRHNNDNDDKADHQDANVVNNCDNHSDGGNQDRQPKKKSLRDEVLNVFSVAMMIVGIITTIVLVALCLLRGFIMAWTCLCRSCERGEESMSV